MRRLLAAGFATAAAVATLALAAPASQAAVIPEHAINVCQSATFYQEYNFATNAPETPLTTLPYGVKVGHTPGKQGEYDGWYFTYDFQYQEWGYMLGSCIGDYGSW